MNKVTQSIVKEKVMNSKKLYRHRITLKADSSTEAYIDLITSNATPFTEAKFKQYVSSNGYGVPSNFYYPASGIMRMSSGGTNSYYTVARVKVFTITNTLSIEAATGTTTASQTVNSITDKVDEL